MPNQYFTAFAAGLPAAGYDLDTATVKVGLIRGYTFNATHASLDDAINAGAIVHALAALASPSLSGGVFDAADTTMFTTFNAEPHNLLLWQASAVTGGADLPLSGQKLILHLDSGPGLPINPGTGQLKVTWNNGLTKIVKVG